MGRLRFVSKFESLLQGATLCAGFDAYVKTEFETFPEGSVVALSLGNRNEIEQHFYRKESSTFKRIEKPHGQFEGVSLYCTDPVSGSDFLHSKTTIGHMVAERQLLFEGDSPQMMAFLRMIRNSLPYVMGFGKAKQVSPNVGLPKHYFRGRSKYLISRIIRKGAIR